MIFQNAISWFEIPTNDINRAQAFYESIFKIEMVPMDMSPLLMRVFPVEKMDDDHVSGALVHHEEYYAPSANAGVLIYLDGNPDLQKVLDRVPAAGGKVLVPKTQISPEHGYMGIILDTEGNRIGLHSRS